MKGNIMDINLRADAPDQSDIIDPKKLSEEVEKLKSIQANIKSKEDEIKTLKEDDLNKINETIISTVESKIDAKIRS